MSGSMYQKIDGQPKIEVLKKSMDTYFAKVPPKNLSSVVLFGTNPKAECKDIKKSIDTNQNLNRWLRSHHPGKFGRTPLSAAIERLLDFEKNEKIWDGGVLILTDGADSCDQDPCQTLLDVDSQLHLKEKIKLNLIGFDLKKEKGSLKCFAGIKNQLDNFDLDIFNADNIANLQSSINAFREKRLATVRIDGAPDSIVFTATSRVQKTAHWRGGTKQNLKKGIWKVEIVGRKEVIPVEVELFEGHEKIIPFGEFFAHKFVELATTCFDLEVEAIPTAMTKKIHPMVEKTKICPSVMDQKIYFGEWMFEIRSPWYLRGLVRVKKDIDPQKKLSLNMKEAFHDELAWVDLGVGEVPAKEPRVLKLDQHKIVILPGTVNVPKIKLWEESWLLK
jgi:hypothetical protein